MLQKRLKWTILRFNEWEPTVIISTHNQILREKLESFAADFPDLCHQVSATTDGSDTYHIDKSRLSIRFMRPFDEQQKARARENATRNGLITGKPP